MNARTLFLIGTIFWFSLAIGHPVLVDIDLVLGLHSPIGPEGFIDPPQLSGVVGTLAFALTARSMAREEPSGD